MGIDSLLAEYQSIMKQIYIKFQQKGDSMSNKPKARSLDQLMAEADELMLQINTDTFKDMEEAHRLEFEKHTRNFKKIKSEVQSKIGNKESSEEKSSADGMHEAIQDIVNAFQNLKNRLF
jgi:ABC-type phosphate transport system auxiliary subunit